MKILILTQFFDPEPGFKLLPLAKELKRRGHNVEVITAFPNYPIGKIYIGYKQRLWKKDIIENIPVLRLPLYPNHDCAWHRRFINYVSFALSASLLGAVLAKKADVVYIYHGPANIGLPAMVLRFLRRMPYVVDVQDLWPEVLHAMGIITNKYLYRLIDKWCNAVYKFSSKVIVESQGFKEIIHRKGVPLDKLAVVYNWCNEDNIRAAKESDEFINKYHLKNKFIFLYTGNMGKVHSLDTVLEVAKTVENRYVDVMFVFIGDGVELPRLKRKATALNLKNVQFLPSRPFSEIADILKTGHVGIVHIKDDPLLLSTLSSKTQAYLASGLPILMAAKGDAANMIEKAKAGIVCIPNDHLSILQAVEYLYKLPNKELRELGDNGQKYYDSILSLKSGVDRIESIFSAIK